MPDWKMIVRSNLKDLDLRSGEREEIAAELASHLEDMYEQFLAQGLCESEAGRLALEETADWKKLAESITRAKRQEDVMNPRTKILWLPGFVAFATASVLLMALERVIMLRPALLVTLERAIPLRPTFWWRDQVLVIYLCWWILLPLCAPQEHACRAKPVAHGWRAWRRASFLPSLCFASSALFCP